MVSMKTWGSIRNTLRGKNHGDGMVWGFRPQLGKAAPLEKAVIPSKLCLTTKIFLGPFLASSAPCPLGRWANNADRVDSHFSLVEKGAKRGPSPLQVSLAEEPGNTPGNYSFD